MDLLFSVDTGSILHHTAADTVEQHSLFVPAVCGGRYLVRV